MAEAALAYVLETGPVLVLRLDMQQRVVAANAQARRILGADVVGRLLAELVVDFTDLPEQSGQGTHLLSLNTVSGMPESYHFRRFALSDGTLALGSPDFQERDRLSTEVLGLNRELNDLTRQLHLANAELRDLNQLKNRFLGMVAHDLRKPIGIIMTYSEFVLAEAGEQLSEQHRRFLNTCQAAAEGMKQMIDNFLDVSIIESGKLRLNLVSASEGEILAPAVELGQLLAAKKKVTLLVAMANEPRRLLADTAKLLQVLLNLVGNAIEHSAPGQRVWLATNWEPQSLVLSVRDEGPGLATKDQQRLFAPFEQMPDRSTADAHHAGLGLAIADQIVQAHGGQLTVESALGRGATFRVVLPAPNPTPTPDQHSL